MKGAINLVKSNQNELLVYKYYLLNNSKNTQLSYSIAA